MDRLRQLVLIIAISLLAGCSTVDETPSGEQDFTGTELLWRDWSGADLRGLTLVQTNMEWSDLSNADLRGVRLDEALLNQVNLRGANLTGANLRGASLNDADLTGAVLTGADLSFAIMNNANLTDADLSGSDLSGADLTSAILTGANLENATLRGTYLKDVDLSDTYGLTEETLTPAFRTYLWQENIRAVEKAAAPACQGEAIPGAATVDQGYVEGAIILLSESGEEHDLSFSLFDQWYPIQVETLSIVACMGDEQETLVEECGNSGIGRYQYSADIRLVAAQSGQTLASYTLQGDSPLPCWAIRDDTTRLDGQHIEPGLVMMWLEPFARIGVGLRNLDGHTDRVWGLAWSPDGMRLASGSYDGQVVIWEVSTREPLHILEGPRFGSSGLAWSPDGRFLAVGAEWGVTIWDTETGELSGTLAETLYSVTSLDWSPDGKLLALGTRGGQLEVWNAQTGDQEAVLEGHESVVTDVQFSPDGQRLASTGYDGRGIIQGVEPGEEIIEVMHQFLSNLSGVMMPVLVSGLDWSPDGSQIITGAFDNFAIAWDAGTGEAVHSYRYPDKVSDISWSAEDGFIAAALEKDTAYLWNGETGDDAGVLTLHRAFIDLYGPGATSVEWSPDGHVLAVGLADNTIMLWDNPANE